MTQAAVPTRRQVWVGMLLYPAHTLPTTLAPVLVASGLAWRMHLFAPLYAMLALLSGWCIHLGGVFTDNYFNLRRHADDEEHADFVAAVRSGVVSLRHLRLAILGCYGLAAVAALPLLSAGGIPVLLFGIVAAAASVAYSAGPFPLGDHALGDALFFTFFGTAAVTGAFYVQAAAVLGAPPGIALVPGVLTPDILWASLPVSALTTNVLIIDNIRDLEYDRGKGEHTLAVVIGARWSRIEYGLLSLLAYVVPIALWRSGRFGAAVLLPLLSLPAAIALGRELRRRRTHDELVPMTPRAAALSLGFALLLATGLAA
ncbi:MAG TPA: 1,4-dihydroxy-2-naphthoate octaprenyltransferase [Gemmatimonadaceae bacterium]|nr:1,4-dihydroxy-2-naphthoate octaprenyltransferase [Gemmatimonadaceae bacterium]